MAKSLVAESWGAFGWQPWHCAEPKLAQVVVGASAEIGEVSWSDGSLSSIVLRLWDWLGAHLGRIDCCFSAQLLRNGIALRIMTLTVYRIG